MVTTKRKHVQLSNGQRYEIYNHYKQHSSKEKRMTYEALIKWAVQHFQLERKPNKSTMSRIIARIDDERKNGGPERKQDGCRIQRGRFPEIEEAVLEWMDISESQLIPITWTMILAKATNIAARRGIEFKGSNGWMDRFVARHDLKKRLTHSKDAAKYQNT